MNQRRDIAIDFVKGGFVAAMLVHHTLNLFPLSWPLIKYVRFVSGAFVFMAGFMVTHIYLVKYSHDPRRMMARLASRAFKILTLYALVNLFARFGFRSPLKRTPAELDSVTGMAYALFFAGDYRILYVDLLVPIAYALLLSGVLVAVLRNRLDLFKWLAVAAVLGAGFYAGPGQYFIRYTSLGLLGAAVGLYSVNWLRTSSLVWVALIAAYLLHMACLPFVGQTFFVYLVLVLLNCAIFYACGARADDRHSWIRLLVLLGQYSLLAYLAQIFILQIVVRVFAIAGIESGAGIYAFLIASVATALSVLVMDVARRRSNAADWVYRQFFA